MKKNIVIIVLVIIILGLGGYIIYDRFLAGKTIEIKEKNDVVEKKEVNKEENDFKFTEEQLSILGKSLLNKITIDAGYCSYPLVSDTDYKKLENKEKLNLINQSIVTAQWQHNDKFDNDKCMKSYDEYYKTHSEVIGNFDASCLIDLLDKNTFENEYYNLFGYENEVKEENYFDNSCKICTFEDDKLKCYQAEGCGGICGSISDFKYISAKQKDLEINVIYEEIVKDMNGNISETKKYESTFKQDFTGNWYWVSTELLK